VQALEDAIAHYDASFPEQRVAAERRLERAQEELKHWQDAEKQQQIRGNELNLENSRNSIEDQEEEMRQLEQLYKGNDLAKESQDIVLNRSKRRLDQGRERYKMAVDRHKRFVEVDIPRREQDMEAGLKSAEIDLQRLKTQQEHGNADLASKMIRARRGLADAQQQLEKLGKDAGALTLAAPHAGYVTGGSDGVSTPLKPGDKLGRGATLLAVIDTSRLNATVSVPVNARDKYPPETKVSVKSDELATTGAGKVALLGILVKDGKISARVEVDNADGKFLPGAKITIGLLE
jgi:multidrug resistance efflux pump